MTDILLAGVGGQGTVLASKLLAACAIARGEKAHTAETIGMAQRGGCVVSHVRLGEDAYSPLIPKNGADILIGFEPAEAVRNLDYLKTGGVAVVNRRAIKPTTDSLTDGGYEGEAMLDFLREAVRELYIIDGDGAAAEAGNARGLNIALLGAASATGALPFSESELEAAIKLLVAEKYVDINIKALRLGAKYAAKAH